VLVRFDTRVALDGDLVGDEQITVAVSAGLLADGGPTLASLTATDTGTTTFEAFVGYLAAVGILSPDYRPRSVQVELIGAPLTVPDRATTVRLTGFGYTTNETNPESVVATIGGVQLGAIPVENGSADIVLSRSTKQQLAFPATGPLQLRLTVPSTGQVFEIALAGS
jgi:hypothetical protein